MAADLVAVGADSARVTPAPVGTHRDSPEQRAGRGSNLAIRYFAQSTTRLSHIGQVLLWFAVVGDSVDGPGFARAEASQQQGQEVRFFHGKCAAKRLLQRC
jgi:hypothetical protein